MVQIIGEYIFYYILLCFILQVVFTTQFNVELSFTNDQMSQPLKLIMLVLFTLMLPFILIFSLIKSSFEKY